MTAIDGDYPCAKLGDFSFSRFDFIVGQRSKQTHTHTHSSKHTHTHRIADAAKLFTPATAIGVSKYTNQWIVRNRMIVDRLWMRLVVQKTLRKDLETRTHVRDKMTPELVGTSETSSVKQESTDTRQHEQLLDLRAAPEMRSLLDEVNREYELHASTIDRYEQLHRKYQQQQQHWSQRHESHDVNNASLRTSQSQPADVYSTWFGWSEDESSTHNDSSQHSSSKRLNRVYTRQHVSQQHVACCPQDVVCISATCIP